MSESTDRLPMPEGVTAYQHNPRVSCDTVIGPCRCGGTHKAEDWPGWAGRIILLYLEMPRVPVVELHDA